VPANDENAPLVDHPSLVETPRHERPIVPVTSADAWHALDRSVKLNPL